MRFHAGAIPESPDFYPEAPWRPMREPTMWMMQLYAFPVGVITLAAIAFLWFLFAPPTGPVMPPSLFHFLLTMAGVIVVHEVIHALLHPAQGCSPHSILGVWPSKLAFYAHYDGELTRNRFVVILLMPLICISLLPLVVAVLFQASPGWIAFVSGLNALFACGDVFGAGLVLYQIPRNSILRNQGYLTYWKPDSE